MNEKLTNYLNGVFAPYDGVKSVSELKADLLVDLEERFSELKAEGKDDQTAFEMTIESIGEIEQTVREVANLSRSLERQVLVSFNASDLPQSDFAGVAARETKFKTSNLRDSNFSNADLTGSLFDVSDARGANFNGADLTNCKFSITDLSGASFRKSILVRTIFNISGQGATFSDVILSDVKFSKTDLRETIFDNCVFNGVDFHLCDLRGARFDGLTFIGVKFDGTALNEASFGNATLKNVSFNPPFAVTNRNYQAMKTICFDGAAMDKLTYASLKGLGIDLSKVTVI